MKTIVITGGNGDIAQAIALELKKNFKVLTPGKNALDIANKESVRMYMERHRPHVLINAAGVIFPGSIAYGDVEDWIKEINVNLIGTYLCCHYALLNGCERIINIGSSAGKYGKPEWSGYCASKAGVERLTQSLHEEGHWAVCLAIGRTKTKMRKALFGEEDPNTLLAPKFIATLILALLENAPTVKLSGQIIPVYKEEN